jgi:hypothetical protein
VLGVIAAGGAFWLPLEGVDRALLLLAGAVAILFGIVMSAKPGDGNRPPRADRGLCTGQRDLLARRAARRNRRKP